MSTYEYNPIDLSTDALRLLRLVHDDDEQSNVRANFTPNLYKALQCLRHQNTDRILWVDAICIDQGNHKERGHQVGQMTLIYRNAENVLIWLGPGTSMTDTLMDWIKRFDQRVVSRPDYRRSTTASWYRVFWDTIDSLKNEHIGETNPDLPDEQRDLAPALYQSPWFRRVWVIQEAASARTATIMYGRKLAPSRTFSLLPMLMNIGVDDETQAVLDIMPGPLRGSNWWEEKRDLETLIAKFYTCEASDPRDKIYALIGICSDSMICEKLRPDYELSKNDVLRKTVALTLFPEITDVSQDSLPPWDWGESMTNLSTLRQDLLTWCVLRDHKALQLALLPKISTDYLLEEFSATENYWHLPCALLPRDQTSDPNSNSQAIIYPAYMPDGMYWPDAAYSLATTFESIKDYKNLLPEILPLAYIALPRRNYVVLKAIFDRFKPSVHIKGRWGETLFISQNYS